MFSEIVNVIRYTSPANFWLLAGLALAVSGYGAWLWFRNAERWRLTEDTPTSKCGFAKRGYIELAGTQHHIPGVANEAPLTKVSCTWWKYSVSQSRITFGRRPFRNSMLSRDWTELESGTSKLPFVIRDETGEVIIDPAHAEVTPSVSHVWYGKTRMPEGPPSGWQLGEDTYRYTEERLDTGTALHAAGWFSPRQHEMLASKGVPGADSDPGIPILSKPLDDHPFILSALSEEVMTARFHAEAWAGFALFVVCGVVAVLAITIRLAA